MSRTTARPFPLPALARWPAAVAVCGGLLLATACGDSGAEGSSGEGGGTTTIRISNPANVSNVPLHIAMNRGYFEDEGLKVEADIDLGAGSTVEAVLGGQVDMAWTNTVGGLTAYQEKLGIRLVALTDTAVTGSQQVLVPAGSEATSLADLRGEKIAVLSPATVCILNVRSGLKAAGLPEDSVEFTPVAPPEHANVLDSGEVAATCTSDPFRTLMQRELGAESIYDTSSGELKGHSVGGYVVAEKFAQGNGETLDRFNRALMKATKYANAHPGAVRDVLPQFTGMEPEVAEEVVINAYLESAEPAAIRPEVQRIADAMRDYGLATDPIDISDYLLTAG